MLAGLRALDLSDGRGALCGRLLADFGVDVVKVEPPGGEPGRHAAPFIGDVEGPERSLSWLAYNAGKRSVVIDLGAADGRQRLRDLVRGADLVIESFDPGYLASIGLDHAALAALNPAIVTTSITPFGQSGPYSGFRAADIIVMGMSGQLLQTGDADRPPLNISLPQACMHAGADAAAGSLIALRHARRSGAGQHVDVSMQHSAAWFLGNTVPGWELARTPARRVGTLRSGGGAMQRQVWPCRDGFVFFFMIGGQQGAKTCRQLVRWMADEGFANQHLLQFEWEAFDMASATQPVVDSLSQPIAAFFATRTKQQVLDAAVQRGISVCPLLAMGDLLDDANLRARDFWTRLPHPALPAGLPYPRRLLRSSLADTGVGGPAPRVGEHDAEVLAEEWSAPRARPAPVVGADARPFAGLTIVAFSWAMVGPLTLKYFADFGATVIRVETRHRPCVTRTSAPFKDRQPGLNRSGYFNHFSANMCSVSLNMAHPEGIALARDLIRKADVVMENFTPGVMDKWGLGWDALRAIKPDLILARQNGFGLDGPYRNLAAFGMIMAAIAGIPNFIGWPDRGPLPVGVAAYTDGISPRFMAAAVIAALEQRDRSGEGQLLDLAQFETSIAFFLPALLERAVNGREPRRLGNAHPQHAPHNVYRCAGDERWCTVAVLDDAQWRALCEVIGLPACARDPRFATAAQRKANEAEVDALVGRWTATLMPHEVMARLQAAGVPAGAVQDAADLLADPQLSRRALFWTLDHAEIGPYTHLGSSLAMDATPPEARTPSPLLGEHNEPVLTGLLGRNDDELVELLVSGALE